jgi:hypothetical protein
LWDIKVLGRNYLTTKVKKYNDDAKNLKQEIVIRKVALARHLKTRALKPEIQILKLV